MFARMRKNEKFLLVLLVGLTLPAFGLPAASFLGGFGKGSKPALEIDGEVITTDAYEQWERRWLGPRRSSRVGKYDAKDFHAHIVLYREAEQAGFVVTDDEVQDFLVAAATTQPFSRWGASPITDPMFADQGGFYLEFMSVVFRRLAEASGTKLDRNTQSVPWDQQIFDDLVARSFFGIGPDQFREAVREDLMVTKLRKAIDMGNYASTFDAYEKLSQDRKEIQIDVAMANSKSFLKEVRKTTPTTEQLEKHYQDNQKVFEEPEKRTVEILVAEVSELKKLVKIDDKEALALYDRERELWRKSKGAKTDAELEAEKHKKKSGKQDDGKKDAKKGDQDGDGLQDQDPAKPAPAAPKPGEPKQADPKKDDPKKDEPKQADPKQDEPNKDEPKKDEPKKDDDVLPYEQVKQQVLDQLRTNKAVAAADGALREVHRNFSALEREEIAAERDPLESLPTLERANAMISKRPEAFLPDAPEYRLLYRRVKQYRSADQLNANLEGEGTAQGPITDFLLADGTTVGRAIAGLYTQIEVGRLSEVLSTGSARLLVRFLDSEGPTTPKFADIKDGPVTEHYLQQAAYDTAKEVAAACRKDVVGGLSLMKAAAKHHLTWSTSGWYMKGAPIPNLMGDAPLLAQSPFFDLPVGSVGKLAFDTKQKRVFVAVMKGRRSPAPKDIPDSAWQQAASEVERDLRSKSDAPFSQIDLLLTQHKVVDHIGLTRSRR